MAIREVLERILGGYVEARTTTSFGGENPMRETFDDLADAISDVPVVQRYRTLEVKPSIGVGSWAYVPWLAIFDSRETTTAQRGVYCVYLFRQDMSGVYLTLNQGVTDRPEGVSRRSVFEQNKNQLRAALPKLAERFRLADDIDLHVERGRGANYELATIAYKFYAANALPSDDELVADLELLIQQYEFYVERKGKLTSMPESAPFNHAYALSALIAAIDSSGFTFEPWQIATYVTALRTKPFVILAGVTGTGKSQLPQLVSRFTGGAHELIAVRPDWTDSADVLGFTNLHDAFQPGAVLRDARRANDNPDRFFTCILDEMNLARVEQYFAEVLSFIESRERPRALMPNSGEEWRDVHLSPNFAIVGTVNMDESSHGFSRKVLDRAFTLELSEIDLRRWRTETRDEAAEAAWPVSAWLPRAVRLSGAVLTAEEVARVESIIELLVQANEYLKEAQLQIGYRSRDEIVLFVLNARDVADSFKTRAGDAVDPLDVALHMKLLPRIIGSSPPVRRALTRLLGWSIAGVPYADEAQATEAVARWIEDGRGAAIRDARFPRTSARLCLMYERLADEESTSFWL